MDGPASAVSLQFDAPLEVANWRPLVQWILAIPHHLIAQALRALSGVLTVISFFAVLFTEKVPEGIYNLQVMALRYQLRVTAYAGFMHESYPKFEFAMTRPDPGGDPVRLSIEAPTGWKRTNAFNFILAIPHYIVLVVFGIGAVVLWIVNFFGVLFTGKWNASHREYIVKVARYQNVVMAYAMMLRNDYPAFGLS